VEGESVGNAIEADRVAWCGQRLTACLIDLILLQLAGEVGVLVALLRQDLAGFQPQILGMAVLIAYQAYLISKTGQSFGKRFCGIRVVRRKSGADAPGFVRGVLLRSWLPIVALVIVAAAIGFGLDLAESVHDHILVILILAELAPVFGARRRCLHDRLAGTLVLREHGLTASSRAERMMLP
jgi:uncharacterized RDD family membrane protein YckC